MALRTLETGSPAEFAAALPSGGVVLAVTDDRGDERYARVRAAAARIAARSGGRVVLFHLPTAPSDLGGPSRLFVPPEVVDLAEPARPHTGSRRSDLLVDEASELRAGGVDVAVWLARTSGPGAIAEAVAATRALLVLVPADVPRTCAAAGRIDRTLAYYAARIPVPLASVDACGRMESVAPLGAGLMATAHQLLGARSSSRPSAGIASGVQR